MQEGISGERAQSEEDFSNDEPATSNDDAARDAAAAGGIILPEGERIRN